METLCINQHLGLPKQIRIGIQIGYLIATIGTLKVHGNTPRVGGEGVQKGLENDLEVYSGQPFDRTEIGPSLLLGAIGRG